MNIHYKEQDNFKGFIQRVHTLKIICDINVMNIAYKFCDEFNFNRQDTLVYSSKELIGDELAMDRCLKHLSGASYVLAVGSGTLNDIAKHCATVLDISCGVLPTAPSMDGYASRNAAIYRGGKKVTVSSKCPEDILIDADVLATSPKPMIGAGVGDILGKYTCLLDWKLSHFISGESYNPKVVEMMRSTTDKCFNSLSGIMSGEKQSIVSLIDALIMAGEAMAENGNSRPASGAEHHMSHFLEMWFIDNNLPVPLHGIKVALGAMVSIELYNYLLKLKPSFNGCEQIFEDIASLPKPEFIADILKRLNCPTKYRELNISKSLMRDMVINARFVRDRYTVLSCLAELGNLDDIAPKIVEKYW